MQSYDLTWFTDKFYRKWNHIIKYPALYLTHKFLVQHLNRIIWYCQWKAIVRISWALRMEIFCSWAICWSVRSSQDNGNKLLTNWEQIARKLKGTVAIISSHPLSYNKLYMYLQHMYTWYLYVSSNFPQMFSLTWKLIQRNPQYVSIESKGVKARNTAFNIVCVCVYCLWKTSSNNQHL